MYDGRTRLQARQNVWGSTPASASGKASRIRGRHQSQKGLPRATAFSHSRDCDSCTPDDAPPHSGVRSSERETPCSYIAWPASWIEEYRHESPKVGPVRVVTRASPGPNVEQNGCAERSWRPRSKS